MQARLFCGLLGSGGRGPVLGQDAGSGATRAGAAPKSTLVVRLQACIGQQPCGRTARTALAAAVGCWTCGDAM